MVLAASLLGGCAGRLTDAAVTNLRIEDGHVKGTYTNPLRNVRRGPRIEYAVFDENDELIGEVSFLAGGQVLYGESLDFAVEIEPEHMYDRGGWHYTDGTKHNDQWNALQTRLYGDLGARVYGTQKGAARVELTRLEASWSQRASMSPHSGGRYHRSTTHVSADGRRADTFTTSSGPWVGNDGQIRTTSKYVWEAEGFPYTANWRFVRKQMEERHRQRLAEREER